MLIQTDSSYLAPRDDLNFALQQINMNPDQYIADFILPNLGVMQKAGKFDVMKRENAGLIDDLHVNGGAFNRQTMSVTSQEFLCVDRGLEGQLTTEDRETFGSQWDVEFNRVKSIENDMRIAAEVRAAAQIFNTTTWTGAALYTDNSGTPWDTITTKITDQITAARDKVRQQTGFWADSMAIGAGAFINILINTEIKGMFPGAAVVTQQMIISNLKAIFGLDNLYVGAAIYNSANEGQSFSGSDIWSDDYAMVFKKNDGDPASGGLGRTMLWESSIPNNFGVIQYGEIATDSEVFRVRRYVQPLVFDAAFGHLMKIDA